MKERKGEKRRNKLGPLLYTRRRHHRYHCTPYSICQCRFCPLLVSVNCAFATSVSNYNDHYHCHCRCHYQCICLSHCISISISVSTSTCIIISVLQYIHELATRLLNEHSHRINAMFATCPVFAANANYTINTYRFTTPSNRPARLQYSWIIRAW